MLMQLEVVYSLQSPKQPHEQYFLECCVHVLIIQCCLFYLFLLGIHFVEEQLHCKEK